MAGKNITVHSDSVHFVTIIRECKYNLHVCFDFPQTTAEQASAEFVGHSGQLVLGMAVLETVWSDASPSNLPRGAEEGGAVSSNDFSAAVAGGGDGVRKNYQVLKLQGRQNAEKKPLNSVVSVTEEWFVCGDGIVLASRSKIE